MWELTRLQALAVLGVALLAGCSGSEPTEQLRPVEADAQARARVTTPFQAVMLEDGKVSYEEYRAAARAVLRCLRAGVVRIAINTRPIPLAREFHYTWWVKGRKQDYERANAVAFGRFQRCDRRFGNEVKRIYNNQRVIPLHERSAVRAKVISCGRAVGIRKVPERASSEELFEVLATDRKQRGGHCLKKYADYFRTSIPLNRDADHE